MKKLYGITVAMITPIDESGRVDCAAIREHVDFLIDRHVDCLYPCGTTGEVFLLTLDERKEIAETVIDQAGGRVPVFIHTGAMTQEETVELSRHAHAAGADGIGVVTPVYFHLDDREMEEYYVAVAGSVPDDYPVYLYNIPQCAANDLTAEVCNRIVSRAPNVVGIKYSFLDMNRTRQYLGVNGGDFSVLHGADKFLTALLPIGLDGVVSGVASVYPEAYVASLKAYQEGDLRKANAKLVKAAAVSSILKDGSNMAYFKAALHMRGIRAGHMRKPLLDLPESELHILKDKLSAYFDIAKENE